MKEIFLDQGFIYAIFVSLRQHKKLNLLMSFQIQSSQNLSDCNWTRTQNHLVHKQTLNHLARLAKWLSVHARTKWFWVRV